MRGLSTLAYRNLWTRKTRTLVTTFGIILGVATVLAVNVTGASTNRALEDFFAQVSGRANLSVERSGNAWGIRGQVLRRVQTFPGVELAVATTLNSVSIQSKKMGEHDVNVLLMGIDPRADWQVRSYHVAEGSFISAQDRQYGLVLPLRFAREHEFELGDDVVLKFDLDRQESFRVVGLLTDEGAANLNFGAVAFTPLETVDEVLDLQGLVDMIDLVASPEIGNSAEAVDALRDALQAELGRQYTVARPAAVGRTISDALSSLQTGLGIFSGVAFIGGFLLVFNTFGMTVAERTREIGLLRALGVSKRQVIRLVLGEALLLALVGSSLGVAFGFFLAIPLTRTMESGLRGIPVSRFVIPPQGLALSVFVGTVVTLGAALLPAWHASRIAPVEAMQRRLGQSEDWLGRYGWIAGGLLLVFAFVQTPFKIISGVSFFAVIVLGGTLLVPVLTPALERANRRAVSLLYGAAGRIGAMNLTRATVRTTLTVGILILSGMMIISVGSMTASFNQTIRHWLNSAAGGDIFVTTSRGMRLEFGKRMASVEGVEAVTPLAFAYCDLTGTQKGGLLDERDETLFFMGIDVPTYRQVASFQFAAADQDEAALYEELARGDAVFISTVLQDLYGLKRGDSIRLRTARGERDFRVAGIVVNFYQGGRSIIGSWRDMDRYLSRNRTNRFIVKLAPGEEESVVRERIEERLGRRVELQFESGREYRETLYRQISGFFSLFNAIGWIIVLVSALGVTNTMMMSVLERVREIGMVRSVGMTRLQVAQMVLAEAAGMGIIGGIFGVGLGVAISRNVIGKMNEVSDMAFDYVFPASTVATTLFIVLVICQLAALYPVWRAVKLQVVEAIQHE
jgi:putative ABC transport system permease protein